MLPAKTGWTVLKMGKNIPDKIREKRKSMTYLITEGKSERWKKESGKL